MDWNLDWNKTILDNLTPAMLAWKNDFFGLPPGGSDEEKTFYWVNFVKALVNTESSNNTRCVFVESFIDDTTGKKCRSCGLLQMSFGDKNSYPDSPTLQSMTDEDQLFDPIFNLKCGLEVMNILISREDPLTLYWSSSDPEKSGPDTLATLKELNGALND